MELKPCPFCGGEVRVWHDGAWYVECLINSCGARTRRFIGLESAIEAWNTRAERTCHDTTPLLSSGMPYHDTFTCSSCGGRVDGVVLDTGDYCPACGAKVVSNEHGD